MSHKRSEFDIFRNVPESLHSTAEIVHQRVPEYFMRLIQTNPQVSDASRIESFWRQSQDGERVEALTNEVFKANIQVIKTHLIDKLSCSLWSIGHHYPGGACESVFAYYDDGTLLWLDSHADSHDFDMFWERENLMFESAYEMALFIMQTKFHYLPQPGWKIVLRDSNDIFYDYPDYMSKQELKRREKKNKQQQEQVAKQIYTPTQQLGLDSLHLKFCVWLNMGGRVLSMECVLSKGKKWSFNAENICVGIGDYAIPK